MTKEAANELLKRITYNPGIFDDKAIIRGMRFRVIDMLEFIGKRNEHGRNPGRLSLPGGRGR